MSLITPYLYLGDAQNAQNYNFLKSKRVAIIVNCAKEVPDFFGKKGEFEYIRLGWNDIPEQDIKKVIDPLTDEIIFFIKNRLVVFVHCAAGISRSSTVVIYTLMKLHNWGFEKSFKFVKDLHPRTNPNIGFVEQLVLLQNPYKKNSRPQPSKENTQSSDSEISTRFDIEDLSEEPKENSTWSKLTLDCEDCEKPKYDRRGKSMYARIF